jgi:hypothetical protein
VRYVNRIKKLQTRIILRRRKILKMHGECKEKKWHQWMKSTTHPYNGGPGIVPAVSTTMNPLEDHVTEMPSVARASMSSKMGASLVLMAVALIAAFAL